MVRWNNAVAIITGGGDGMGLEMAAILASTGCDLALVDLSLVKLDAAEKKCRQRILGSTGVRKEIIISKHVCDVSDRKKVNDLPREVVKNHKCANRNILLFNNAGIGGGVSLVTSTEEDFDRVLNIDWGGVYYCTRAFLPLMMVAPAAHIINTSSICGFYAHIGYLKPNVSYSAAKFAVRGFTLGLITDFKLNAPHIKVSCVMPGWIGTGLIDSSQQMLNTTQKEMLASTRVNGRRHRRRIGELLEEGDKSTVALGEEGLLDDLGYVDLNQYTDEQLLQRSRMLGPGFRAMAMTSAKEAAEIILRGVANDEWSILVGKDAHSLAKLVKEDEMLLYEDDTIVPDFFNYSTWKMNRGKYSKL
jgi:NAD(P)-dependent dehydrogenase (short-subunit alcohol dehydrogenase family)